MGQVEFAVHCTKVASVSLTDLKCVKAEISLCNVPYLKYLEWNNLISIILNEV
jgi:hypothetical protein